MADFWLLGIVVIVLSAFVIAGVLQGLWNTTMPDVFGIKRIAYWQAFRLLMIGTLLFGPVPFLRLTF